MYKIEEKLELSYMQCPKCHTKIEENVTICPVCRKVLLLECPNCHSLGESSVCEKCGYTILVKCSKCGKTVPLSKEKCTKCGFSTSISLAHQECESDEFASILVKFESLRKIRKNLKSQELYAKFFYKLKNLLYAQFKGIDCKVVAYNDSFVINFNKELSFSTSLNKAVRLALKIVNSFVCLNLNIIQDFAISLNLTLTITKKNADRLQDFEVYESNVKPLVLNKKTKKYLRGMQIIVDQYVADEINKNYKIDSLYSVEQDGENIMFYEIILDSYVLPPSEVNEEQVLDVVKKDIKTSEIPEKDIYSFNIFDINAKCFFEKVKTTSLIERLSNIDLNKNGKIISLSSDVDFKMSTAEVVDFYKKNDYKVLTVMCNEEMHYRPWGFFDALFREYFEIPFCSDLIDLSKVDPKILTKFKSLFNFILAKPLKAMSPEDARFAYMEAWNNFLSILNKTVIIVDGFEYLDDTSIQTLELYFDKYKSIKPNFLFVTSKQNAVHAKLKTLLRTSLYTEFSLQKTTIDECLALIKSDATDFIQSFYFEKIKENFKGSLLYFKNALEYLKDTGVLIEFENRLLVNEKKSVIIPKLLNDLYRERIKFLSKNKDISYILAFLAMLGANLDTKTLSAIGIENLENNINTLVKSNIVKFEKNRLYINDSSIVSNIVKKLLKKEAEVMLAKMLLTKIGKGLDDTSLAIILGKISAYKEEYLTLWKNSQFAIKTGDFDAYLKNCLGFLSLVEHIESNISKEEIEENKKDVYNNILMSLYSYSPAKIYFIENILLMDAIEQGDDDKIVKLSNLMLQGALISSNYTDALGLLHNILSRMKEPTLKVDGKINTKFLLLSLVKIEILYNIGDYRQCIEIANDILSVLSSQIIEEVKPASFSVDLFVSHILDTFRLVAFAKLLLMDDDLEEFFDKINETLEVEFPDKDCVLAIKDFLAGKVYSIGNVDKYSSFSKIIFLILQEFSVLNEDYKRFAQNIYQAKVLASEIHNRELELFCDLLIGFAYCKSNILEKSEVIFADVLSKAEDSAMFNLVVLSKYFIALQNRNSLQEESLLLINEVLSELRKYDNQHKIYYVIFEKFYIDFAEDSKITMVDVDSEKQKISEFKENLKLFFE